MPLSLVHVVEGLGRFGLFLEGGKLCAVAYNSCMVTHLELQACRVTGVGLFHQ